MDDHDEMTGAQAWVEWEQAERQREHTRALFAAVQRAIPGEVFGPIVPPGGGPPPGSAIAGMLVHRRGPEPTMRDLMRARMAR